MNMPPVESALRIAFIGAGQMARHHVAAIGAADTASTIVGVYDAAPGRAEGFAAFAGTTAFQSTAALLAEARPDIVHVCTPPPAHFAAAAAALEAGAHVYVEKPFALTASDARALLALAQTKRRLVCAGHQLLHDPAFEKLMARAPLLGTPVQVDSHFAFRPIGAASDRGSSPALARQLVDVLPHPLYSLIAVMERLSSQPIELAWAIADATDVQAVLRAGTLTGRLSVSLRARPIASSIVLTGTDGALTCDFVRSILIGAANPGTEALEKILNPIAEGAQLISRSGLSVARRLRSATGYSGLPQLVAAFYRAVATGADSPVPPHHLQSVARVFEELVANIDAAVFSQQSAPPPSRQEAAAPLTVVTGAGGFLGAAIARAIPRVRGIGRGPRPDDVTTEQWLSADLSAGLAPEALAGADVVVHAAAETSGGFDAHQRNTLDATRHVLRAMHAAGVSRLILVSSLSVLRPPRTPWEQQDESTPRPAKARALGAYTWGKCLQEELVEREAAALGISTRIIRPGALVDWQHAALPGLMGRRLFGRWHLGLGRPRVPIAVCDLEQCAEAIAWCAAHFEAAPPVVNLLDPAIPTRGAFIERLRARGWQGRMVWVPISLIALGLTTARTLLSLSRGQWPERLSAWSVLKPRRYRSGVAASMLGAARPDGRVPPRADVALQL
jgi:predicted dehydrogenase/nucleoside-diphosphate-sugar epimerase